MDLLLFPLHFSYSAIKAYKTEDKVESLGATEHLVSAAEAGKENASMINTYFQPVHMVYFIFVNYFVAAFTYKLWCLVQQIHLIF